MEYTTLRYPDIHPSYKSLRLLVVEQQLQQDSFSHPHILTCSAIQDALHQRFLFPRGDSLLCLGLRILSPWRSFRWVQRPWYQCTVHESLTYYAVALSRLQTVKSDVHARNVNAEPATILYVYHQHSAEPLSVCRFRYLNVVSYMAFKRRSQIKRSSYRYRTSSSSSWSNRKATNAHILSFDRDIT